MKGKALLMVAALGSVSAIAFAQITTGTPSSSTIKTGNRAEAGDFGLYFGATTDIVKDIFDSDVNVSGLPLLNFKYMYTDEIEFRIGLEAWLKREREKWEINGDEEYDIEGSEGKYRNIDSRYFVYPGVAYHFSKSNLVDVYAGAEIPIGFEHYKRVSEVGDMENTVSRALVTFGVGAFVGLQFYVADLPLAVGVEYGLSSLFKYGGKYKFDVEDEDGSQTYYRRESEVKVEKDGNLTFSGNTYDDLKAVKGDIGQQVRISLTYYFKK